MTDNETFKVFVGVDGSEGADAAVRWAVREGRAHQGTVTAVMAWSFLDQRPVAGQERFDPHYDETTADRALHEYIVRAVGADDAELVLRRPVCDLPANTLIDASAEADLLVVGSRGLGGFKRLMLGSVAHQVVTYSKCPVVVVPTARDNDT